MMADQQLGDAIALLGELNALDAQILAADQIHTLVPVSIVLVLRVTADVMEQAEIDQDLLVLLGQVISGILAVQQRQEQYPKDVLDTMMLEQVLGRVTQG